MMKIHPARVIASILAISLVVGAPGAQAWGQVAATVRPGSVGARLTGLAGSIAPTSDSFAIPALSISAPSLFLSAPGLAPVASALSAAEISAAAGLAPAAPFIVAPVAVMPATEPYGEGTVLLPIVGKGPALTASLSAVSAQLTPASDKTFEGSLGWLSSFFDGLITRRLVANTIDPGSQNEAQQSSGLGRPQQTFIAVLVTLADPGSARALGIMINKMHQDLGFRLDLSYSAVRAPGVLTVRGAIPVTSLQALSSAPGVVAVAAASGRAHVAPASALLVGGVPAPVRENLLRAGLRSLMHKSLMLGIVATLPLQFAVMVAFVGPVMGGIMLGGAAAVLKPWMLGTAFGMAASFSFLAPLFSWIPLKLRVAATYGAAASLAWSFNALAPGLPALWLAANLLLGLLATLGSLATLAKAANKSPIDKIVNSTEAAAFLNILGYQATLPILLLSGMMPLAFGILAVSTALALLLLIKIRARAVAPSAGPIRPPAMEGPTFGDLLFDRVVSQRPAHEPFIAATRVVADMEKLFKTDPAAALKVAAAAILNEKRGAPEIKIGAQRIVDALPIEQTLPHYLDLLKLAARADVQALKVIIVDPVTLKEVNVDPWWYLQRTALKRLSREASALKPGTPDLIDALKTTYKDRNASVRVAAADALAALGIEPGPEVNYEVVSLEPGPDMQPSPNPRPAASRAPKKPTFMGRLPVLLLAAFLGWWAFGNHAPSNSTPSDPTEITETIKAPGSAVDSVPDPVKADPRDAALEQIAKDTKRTADAAERSARAAEEMAKPKGSFLSTLMWTVLPIVLLVVLMRQFMGGAMGKVLTKPKMNGEKPTVRFSDVAGIDESLVEVQEIIDFLRDPARFKKLGARMPKGVLMEGPPGTGKTLLARALAGEADAKFYSVSGSDFVELFVGNGARKVRDLFELARDNAPSIIFIDEIDAVGKTRGSGGFGGGHEEREQTVNQILKEMDGFDNSSGVIVVAATNQADTLDAALTRPGRFDRKIHVGLPEAMGREAILVLHAKQARLSAEVDLRLIARRTAGLSGAFLEVVINEAALLAARRGADSISPADIDEAVDRATIGGKRSLRLSEPLKRRLAVHEAGHVLAILLHEKPELRVPVNKVTIIPHGAGALGFAEPGSEEGDKYLYTRGELEARLDGALGGLVAEKIFYGEWSTGPGSDLEAATRVARAMVQQLGMSEEMGLAQTGPNQYGQSAFGSETDAKALAAINKLLEESKARVEKRLRDGTWKHKAMIEALMEKETLSADEIEAIAHPKPQP